MQFNPVMVLDFLAAIIPVFSVTQVFQKSFWYADLVLKN